MKRILPLACAVTVFILLLWCIITMSHHALAEAQCSTKRNSTLKRDRSPGIEAINRAIAKDPQNGAYWYKQARQKLNPDAAKTMVSLEHALTLSPVKGRWWRYLGSTYAALGYAHTKDRSIWLPRADNAYILAEYFAPQEAKTLSSCAQYWMWRSRVSSLSYTEDDKKMPGVFPASPHSPKTRIEKSRTLFRRSLTLQSRTWKKAVQYVANVYPDQEMIISIIPPENTRLKSRVQKWLKEQKLL